MSKYFVLLIGSNCLFTQSGGANNSSDTESLPSPHSSEDSKAKEDGSGRTKSGPAAELAGPDAGQAGDENPPAKEDAAVKQEIKTESGESSKEQQQQQQQHAAAAAAAAGEAADKKPPASEMDDVKSSAKNSKKDPATKSGSHGDSDSSATCSADEVEESDNTDKSRLEH